MFHAYSSFSIPEEWIGTTPAGKKERFPRNRGHQ
jgi:hypothetical protein